MAQNDRIRIGQKACILAGVNVISTFDDDSAEAVLLRNMYEEVVESEMSLYYWRFATKSANIKANLLAAAPANTMFNVAYQQPSDVVSIDTLMVADRPINYEREGDQILTNDTADDEVVVKYRYRADETDWLPYFRMLIIYRLAALLAWAIARRVEVAKDMNDAADLHSRKAKTQDAQSQTNKKVVSRNLSRRRAGGVERFWRDR